MMLNFRQGLCPCPLLYCPWRLPIRWLCVNAVAQSLDYTRCNTQDCWCSLDALLMHCWRSVDAQLTLCWRSLPGELTLTLTIVPIMVANSTIMDKDVAQPLDDTRCNTQYCWPAVDAHFQTGAVTMSHSLLPTQAANMFIKGKCCSTNLGLFKMQHPRLSTLCWRSVDVLLILCWCSVDTHYQVKRHWH
jgi:hypothetical protein